MHEIEWIKVYVSCIMENKSYVATGFKYNKVLVHTNWNDQILIEKNLILELHKTKNMSYDESVYIL